MQSGNKRTQLREKRQDEYRHLYTEDWKCLKCNFLIKHNRAIHSKSCKGKFPKRRKKEYFERLGIQIKSRKGLSMEEFYGKEKSDLIKKKLSESLKKNWIENPTRKLSKSDETKRRLSESHKKAHREGRGNNWYHSKKMINNKSRLESILESLLIQNKIDHVFQFRCGRYFLDFAILEFKIDLEMDGKQHLKEKQILHDEKRDLELESDGWIIYRIAGVNFYKNPNEEFQKFLNFLKEKEKKSIKYDIQEIIEKQRLGTCRGRKLHKRQENKKLKYEKIKRLESKILNSGIDFSKLGWIPKLRKVLDNEIQSPAAWMRKNMTDFYNANCFKKKRTKRL